MALDGLKFMIEEDPAPRTKIRVFGVGGGGSNAVGRMLEHGLTGVEFCLLNTDAQALESCVVPSKLTIGLENYQRAGRGIGPSRRAASRTGRY
jgi:cell division GTPase FtsZ